MRHKLLNQGGEPSLFLVGTEGGPWSKKNGRLVSVTRRRGSPVSSNTTTTTLMYRKSPLRNGGLSWMEAQPTPGARSARKLAPSPVEHFPARTCTTARMLFHTFPWTSMVHGFVYFNWRVSPTIAPNVMTPSVYLESSPEAPQAATTS